MTLTQVPTEAPDPPNRDRGRVTTTWKVEKFWGDPSEEDKASGRVRPYEVVEGEDNLFVNVGIALMLDLLIGAGGTVFSNANARIGVGDGNGSVPTPAASDTDLTAPTNKLRKGMDATFPSRSGQTLTWKATFTTAEANFRWREWILANAATSPTILNHRGVDLGEKTSAASWSLTVTTSVA